MSWISWATSWRGEPEIAVLNLRGRLENSSLPMNRWTISWTAGVPSMISSAAMPATGDPRMTRGTSPQASAVLRPTPSSACQMSGTSSIRTQCSWTFCRSVRSAVSRAYLVETSPMVRSALVVSCPPSIRTRIMKYLSSSSSGSRIAVRPPSMPGARCVYSPHQRNRPRRSPGSMPS